MMMQLENGSQDQLAAGVVGSVGDGGREGGSEGGRPVIREREDSSTVRRVEPESGRAKSRRAKSSVVGPR